MGMGKAREHESTLTLTPALDLDDSNVMAYRVLGVLMRDAVPTS